MPIMTTEEQKIQSKMLAERIASMVKYDPKTTDSETIADAIDTANWCISQARLALGLPDPPDA